MKWTRLSFFYLITYLALTGLALLISPDFVFKALMSNGHYDPVFPRCFGLMMIGLAIVVFRVVQLRVEPLYTTTLLVRALFLIGFTGFYIRTQDPFFLGVVGVIGLGVLLTTAGYFKDRSNR